jgi:hypothetical protein
MGFKNLLLRNTREYVYNLMLTLTSLLETAQDIADNPFIDKPRTSSSKIAIMVYSDSIMLYSKDNSPSAIKSFTEAIQYFIGDLFYKEIPFRGAISFGTMTLDFDNSIFLGQALVDAYLLSEELNFYGIVVHGTAERETQFIAQPSIIEYDCPFKNGIARHFTITPLNYDMKDSLDSNYEQISRKINNLKHMTSGTLRKNIDNTLKYISHSYASIKK